MRIDSYVLQARVAPVLIVLAPAIALFAAVAGSAEAGSWFAALLGVAGAAVGLGLSDGARKRGRVLEQRRWNNQGSPTIRAVMADTADGAAHREKILTKFGIDVEDRTSAETASEALRQHARRSENVPVAAANIEYGRARNLYALRRHGLVIALATASLSLVRLVGWMPSQVESLVLIPGWAASTVLVVSGVVLWHLLFTVTEAWLEIMDQLYTKRLLGYLDLITADG